MRGGRHAIRSFRARYQGPESVIRAIIPGRGIPAICQPPVIHDTALDNTFVVEAGAEYRLLGVNALDEFTRATPAIAGDRLLIRTQRHLYEIRQRH